MTNRFDMSKVHQVLAKGASTVHMEIQSYKSIGNGFFSIIASLTNDATVEQVHELFAELTDGKAGIVEGTIGAIAARNPQTRLVKFMAQPNRISKPYTDETVAGMKTITANVLADDNNIIWKVAGEGEERRLVLQSNDNLEELYAMRRSRLPVVASVQPAIQTANNDYVAYMNTQTGQIGFGFGLKVEGSYKVYDRTIGALVGINDDMVLETLSGFQNDPETEQAMAVDLMEINANLSAERAEKVIAYYRKVYSSKPELMAKWEKMIRDSIGRFSPVFQTPVLNNSYRKVAMV